MMSIEEIYKQHIKPLLIEERLRLIEMIAHDLAERPVEAGLGQQYDWMLVRGIAPQLLDGEDAQEWVSRTRREADEQRDRQWKRNA
jgi:hypothetical protein